MTSTAAKRAVVAQFHKRANGRFTLWSVVTIEEKLGHDGRAYKSRTEYDVEHSRRYGYIFHQSGGGGSGPINVDCPYVTSGEVEIKESPCRLVDSEDKAPWRSQKTRAIRQRNRTRQLRAAPKAFNLEPAQDILDWLERNAIDSGAVYCSECNDWMPDYYLCEHCWWCDKSAWFSTPSERCGCESRLVCEEC